MSSIKPFTFVHIADTHITAKGSFAKNLAAIVEEINTLNPQPAFVLSGGDQTEMGFTEDYAQYRSLVAPLQVPLYNVSGNHEAKWSNWGRTGVAKFLEQEPYYSFGYGGIHFIGLDTSMWLEHNGFIDQSQLTWLKADLESTGHAQPIILFYHHCPGFLPNELELLRLLRPYNVRLALVAHGHSWQEWKMNGIVFQMTEAGMNNPPTYRIVEVNEREIRTYRGSVGGERLPDTIIPLPPAINPVTLTSPEPLMCADGHIRIAADITHDTPLEQIEYGIDGVYHPASDGACDITVAWDKCPGWHTASVRATDRDGMAWYDSASVRIGDDGREAWRVQTSGAISRPVRAAGERLYFGVWGGGVYCLDARSGREVWRRNVDSDVTCEVAVSDDRAYLGAADGRIITLDSDTGEPIWEFKTDGPVIGSPVAADGMIFVGSGDHGLYALDTDSGKLRWKIELPRMTQSLPLYMNGVLYFGAWDQHFHAIDARDGSERWKTHIGEIIYFSPANSNPATDGERIVVAATPWHPGEPDIFCMDSGSGDIIWSRRNPGEKSHCAFNSPYIAGDRVYIASLPGELFCLSLRDGSEIWRAATGQETYDNSPIFSEGKIYIGGLTGGLFCLDAATGEMDWSYSVGGAYLFASPTVWEDLIIVPSTEGTVTAVPAGNG